jgi:hypothetical protein
MRPLPSLYLACALLLSAVPAEAQALRNPTDVIAQGTSYHVFAQPGEATIEVLVLGSVAAGVYVVGEATSLTQLIALAGGAGEGQRSPTVDVERTVRLMREQGGERVVLYEAEVDQMLRSPSQHPTLMGGDLVTVDTEVRNRFSLRDTLAIVSSLASVTLLILRVTDGSN